MSYRKLNINGKEYKYVIGKKFTKIVDVGNFKNSEIGTEIDKQVDSENLYIVTPSTIRSVITGEPANKLRYCRRHNFTTTKTVADPYMSEIHGEYHPIPACPDCVQESEWEI